MSVTSPIGIESITYGVEDLDAGARFYQDFGLINTERGQRGQTLCTKEGTTIQLRLSGDAALPPAIEGGSTVREVVWGVKSKADLESIAAELAKDREVRLGSDGKLCSRDPDGVAIAFQVTGRTERPAAPPPPARFNVRAKFYDRAAPDHIAHVVFFTPNATQTAEFYIQRLGFRLSDSISGFGMFMRCSSDHHNLFLIRNARPGLNHVSFRLNDFDEIMAGKEFLEKKGWRPVWGPGRHVIGSNLFYYFANPCGGFVEYYADMDCITDPDSWIPRTWDPTPDAFASWGPPPPEEMLR